MHSKLGDSMVTDISTESQCEEGKVSRCVGAGCGLSVGQHDGYVTPTGDHLCYKCTSAWAENGEFL